MSKPKDNLPLVPIVFLSLALCFGISSFVLEIVDSKMKVADGNKERLIADVPDLVSAAGLGFSLMALIFAGVDGKWRVSAAAHSSIAGALWFIFGTLSAIENQADNATGNVAFKKSTSACVLAWAAFAFTFVAIIWYFGTKIQGYWNAAWDNNKKTQGFDQLCCLIAMGLTPISLACMLTASNIPTTVQDLGASADTVVYSLSPFMPETNWIYAIFIAHCSLTFLVILQRLFWDYHSSFGLHCLMAAITGHVFWITAVIEVTNQSSVFLAGVILSAVNSTILLAACYDEWRDFFNKKDTEDRIHMGTVVFTTMQFAIAMTIPYNSTPTTALSISHWERSVLTAAVCCVYISFFFGFMLKDAMARWFHIFVGFLLYTTYFIADCVKHDEGLYGGTSGQWVCALVFGAITCVLLLFLTFLYWPAFDCPKTPAEIKNDACCKAFWNSGMRATQI